MHFKPILNKQDVSCQTALSKMIPQVRSSNVSSFSSNFEFLGFYLFLFCLNKFCLKKPPFEFTTTFHCYSNVKRINWKIQIGLFSFRSQLTIIKWPRLLPRVVPHELCRMMTSHPVCNTTDLYTYITTVYPQEIS